MKYRELPSAETLLKLTQVSFNSPSKNLSVYRLAEQLRPHQSYIENERVKLIHKYGEEIKSEGKFVVKNKDSLEKFSIEFNATLDAEVPDKIECPSIKEEDFEDDNCLYPIDKSMWPNAKDIASFFNFCNELNKENRHEKNGK